MNLSRTKALTVIATVAAFMVLPFLVRRYVSPEAAWTVIGVYWTIILSALAIYYYLFLRGFKW